MSENFLQAGFHEIGRKFSRAKLRRDLRTRDAERAAAVVVLGQRAWEAQLDLSAFGDLRDRLRGLDARAGDLSSTQQKLDADRAALDAERRTALHTYAGRRQAVLEKKAPIDADLHGRRSARVGCEQTIRTTETRIAAIDAALRGPNADTATLDAEQSGLRARADAARTEFPALAAEEHRLDGASRQLAAEIAAIDAEEKATIARIDAAARQVQSDLRGATKQAGAVQVERTETFRVLGQNLLDAGIGEPALADALERIAGIDQARAQSVASHDALLAHTRAMPRGTMLQFWMVVIGLPLLLATTSVAVWRYSTGPDVATVAAAAAPGTAEAEDQKLKTVERFISRGRWGGSELRDEAVAILADDILALGATADPAHLATLVKVLRSREPRLRAAAADAIGMIGPTPAETAELARLRQDPVPEVAKAARTALSVSFDPAANELAKR